MLAVLKTPSYEASSACMRLTLGVVTALGCEPGSRLALRGSCPLAESVTRFTLGVEPAFWCEPDTL